MLMSEGKRKRKSRHRICSGCDQPIPEGWASNSCQACTNPSQDRTDEFMSWFKDVMEKSIGAFHKSRSVPSHSRAVSESESETELGEISSSELSSSTSTTKNKDMYLFNVKKSSFTNEGMPEVDVLGGREFEVDQSSLHKGVRELSCRSSQQGDHRPKRMGTESASVSGYCQEVGNASDRPDGDQAQQEGGQILFLVKTGEPKLPRCNVFSMEFQESLHFSTSGHDTESSEEDQARTGINHFDSTLLAKESLVHGPDGSIQGDVLDTATEERSVSTRPNVSSKSIQMETGSMEFDKDLLINQGLSQEVVQTLLHSRKQSTSKVYNKVWKIFSSWCVQRDFQSMTCPVAGILQFLQDGFDKGLKPATLKVHLAAISAITSRVLTSDPLIKRFIKGMMRLRPSVKIPVAAWDLNLVLSALCKHPFEPLDSISQKLLALKTAFLVAITSARRVGELQALAANPPYTLFFPEKVVLRTLPFFRPKVPSTQNINAQIILPSFFSGAFHCGGRRA
ncbi:uncharacterized protein LOC121399947 [Xenopus laevis]|uniref:Uncharacterized protein LOC121399947 n=1 Tax=Xenopus laevis TaxID=8355 RepID=A0A8J1M866_XENLA|nr:uncharacterized protein LOC121399947 [Xenopus laevis]